MSNELCSKRHPCDRLSRSLVLPDNNNFFAPVRFWSDANFQALLHRRHPRIGLVGWIFYNPLYSLPAAILFLAFIAFLFMDYLLSRRKSRQMTASGYVRGGMLAGILISGIFLVIRNLAGTNFSSEFIIFLDLCHLGLAIAFLFVSLYCLFARKQWTTAR